jgi:integrase
MNNSLQILSAFGADQKLDLTVINDLPLADKSKSGILEVGTRYHEFLEREGECVSQDSVVLFLKQTEDPVTGKEIAPSTRNLRKSLLKRLLLSQPFFNGHLDRQHQLEEAFKRVKASVVDRKIGEDEYLTMEEMEAFWKCCNRKPMRVYKIYLLTKALFQSACRINELLSVRIDNCKPNGHVAITLNKTKRNKTRTVFIEREIFDKTRKLYGGKKLLFESERGNMIASNNILVAIKRIGREAGIAKNIKNHTWRHSAAMFLLKPKDEGGKGLSVKQASVYLGHASSSILIDFYLHDMPTAESVLG